MAGKIPDELKRIATSTQIRGLAYIQPNAAEDSKEATFPKEGPAVIVHGLTCNIPGVPHHHLTLLEAAQEISIARMGALNAQIELLVGECRITCRDPKGVEPKGPVVGKDPENEPAIQFPLCLPQDRSIFKITNFPADPNLTLYIQSTKSVAVLLTTAKASHHTGGHDGHDDTAVAAETSGQLDPYSGSCTAMCSSGCPHKLLFSGDPT